MPRNTLHHPDQIFSFRHVPSWLMFAFAAGCINATAFVACARFVTHVTGTVTEVGMAVARLDILLDFSIVFASFVAGASAAAFLINGRVHRGKRPLHAVALVAVALATAAVAIAGHAGLLGEFGGDVDQPGDFVLLSILSFASGLQNAAVATSTGLLVRTTHLTGPATDLGVHLVEMVHAKGDARAKAYRHALLRGGKIVAFVLGAALGATLAHAMQYLTFLVPAALVLAATGLSFVGAEVRSAADAPARGASA
jgi:uncharacterized membrane protein YoaK (UPF0700 family)